jgi:hypothetical protein
VLVFSTNFITPWIGIIPEKLIVVLLVEKFFFYGN